MTATSTRLPLIQSLARADAILAAIAGAPMSHARLSDIAARTCLHKNTAFSLLQTLKMLGYVRQLDPSRDYALGSRLFELARLSESDLDILRLVRPLMLRSVHAVHESACLAIPAQKDILIVSTVEGSRGARGARFQGHRSPYHASAAGKAMLAFMPPAERDAILSGPDLRRFTPRTAHSMDDLLRQLETAGQQGYALSLEEEEIGANAVAVPILSAMGDVLGAVAVWGPAPRLTPDRLTQLGISLAREAQGLAQRIH